MQITIRDIKLGPEHLERTLSARFERGLDNVEKLIMYQQLIEKMETESSFGHSGKFRIKYFCLGYLYQQVARLTEDRDQKERFYECALNCYRKFILRTGNGEEDFFACFSVGILLQALDQPWLEAEQKFLEAYKLNPRRGEPIDRIIQYYLAKQQWAIAFLFSSSAKEQFYGKPPDQGNWGIDKSFYSWRILHLHIAACFSLGRMKEATENFAFLYSLTLEHTEIFLPREIDLIHSQKSLFPEFEIYVKDSA